MTTFEELATLSRKAETLATLASDYHGLIQSGEFTEALGLLRVMARMRIELETLTERAAYADNVPSADKA